MPKQSWFSMQAAAEKLAEIFIFAEIGLWGITAKDFAKELKALGDVDQIDLHLNTPGGSVWDGLAIYNLLKQHSAQINVHIDGLAASMGSVIAMAGDHIAMPENAMLMIHNPSTGAWGEAKDMKKAADILEKAKAAMIPAYVAQTGLTVEQITEMMDEETWMTGEEAHAFGFTHELTDSLDMAACLKDCDLSAYEFQNVPDALLKIGSGSSNQPIPSGAAAINPKEKVNIMPKTATPAGGADDQTLTAEQITANALAADKKRRDKIATAFTGFEAHHDLMRACQDDQNCGVDAARAKLLEAVGNSQNNQPHAQDVRVATGDCSQRKRFIEHAANALAARAGLADLSEGNELRGYSLTELARMSLAQHGQVSGFGDKMALVASAFTHGSGDFATLLSNTANKGMLKGYESAAETFQKWTAKGELPDFKISQRADLGAFPSLKEVAPGAEYKSATIGERGEQVQLATYGSLFSITRQAIINDDLGAFTRIPEKMGRAAIRTVGNLVYAVLNDNPVMGDGVALFHANHANLAGSGAAPNTATVSAARDAMASQKDGDEYLNIALAYLLCPVSLGGAMRTVINSEYEVGASSKNNTTPNDARGAAEVITDARLTGTAWYGAANQSINDTVEVQYLDGNDKPVLEQQNGWGVDGVEFKVRMDAGVKALDFRGLYKNAGA